MKNKNQTSLKNFKPKINLNHNIYNPSGQPTVENPTADTTLANMY